MALNRKTAQSMLEYVILFGLLTVMVATMLVGASGGDGKLQSALKSYISGS